MLSNTHSDAGHFRVCYGLRAHLILEHHNELCSLFLILLPSIVHLATQQFLSCCLPFSLRVVLANNDMKQVLHCANRAGYIHGIKNYCNKFLMEYAHRKHSCCNKKCGAC